MAKIQMKNAIAELDGDEMTRVLWAVIKEKLLEPFIDLKTEYYDLGLKSRDDSDVVVVSSSFLQEAAEKMKIAAAARSIVFLKSIALKLFSPKRDIQITNIGNFQQKPVHLCKYFAAGE